jgi:hypothetical protein
MSYSDQPLTPLDPPPLPLISQLPDRSGFLIAFGIIEALIGLFFILIIVMMAGMRGMIANAPNAKDLPPNFMLSIVMVYGTMAAVFFVMALGSILRRNWGRIFALIVSWFWLGVGVIAVLGSALIMPQTMRTMPQAPNAPQVNVGAVVGIAIIIMTIFMVAMPLLFVIFYSRPSVKATCLRGSGITESKFPGVIAALMAWYGLSFIAMFYSLASSKLSPLFGIVLPFWASKAYVITVILLLGYIVYGLHKRERLAWNVALGFTLFTGLSWLVTMYAGDLMDTYRRMGMTERELESFTRMPAIMGFIKAVSFASLLGQLALLWFAKKYFDPQPPASAAMVDEPTLPPSPREIGPAM